MCTHEAISVTMRTPGNDFELAVGFCVTEGILRTPDDLASVAYCLAGEGEQEYNVVTVKLRRPVDLTGHERAFAATASCGLCGKATLDQVEQHCAPVADGPVVARSVLVGLPAVVREAQTLFEATGGLHAAARCTPDGELLTGVRYRGSTIRTHSIVTRSRSGTVRLVESEHSLDKLRAYAYVDFGHAT